MNHWHASPDTSPRNTVALAVGLIIAAAALRLVFYQLPNVAPVAAMALFGGAILRRPIFAFGVPLAALALSDLAVNAAMLGEPLARPNLWVYGAFLLIGLIGFAIRRWQSPMVLAGASVTGSVLFFVVTNFGVWAQGLWYPLSPEGLAACYVAAIPFFGQTVLGDLLFNAVLFGAYFSLQQAAERPATS